MINNQRFDLLLKSYLRTSGFSVSQASKICKVSSKRFKQLCSYPIDIPELEEVFKVIKNLKIPTDVVWQAYMNSVIKNFYQGQEVLLMKYDEYKAMVKNNKKHRPKKMSIPHEEVFMDIFKDDYSLLDVDLAHYVRFMTKEEIKLEDKIDIFKNKDILPLLVKRLELKKSEVLGLLEGKIPNNKLLTKLALREPTYKQGHLLGAYLMSVIKKYNLNYKIEIYNQEAYNLLLDQVHSRKD